MTLLEKAASGLHDAVFSALPPLPQKASVLDIGCGTGAWLSRFADRGGLLVGVDADAARIEGTGIRKIAANIDTDDVDLGGDKFHLVSAIEVIEHLENPGRLLALASRVLLPGGVFVLTTPNVDSIIARLKHLVSGNVRSFDDKGDPTHITPIPLSFVSKVFPRHGLAVDCAWGYPRAGTNMARRSTMLGMRFLDKLFPVVVQGDILCVLARRVP